MATTQQRDVPGHFIAADSCRWFLHHDVGPYCVSSVGDYRPRYSPDKAVEIGCGRLYETFVFDRRLPEGDGRWTEIDANGHETREGAEAGHAELLAKYELLAEGLDDLPMDYEAPAKEAT